jgi:DNA replication protein DnaC
MVLTATLCPECGGTGWVLRSADGERIARECGCQKQEARLRRFHAAEVPERYRDCSFEDFRLVKKRDKDSLRVNDSLANGKRVAQEFADAYPFVESGLLFMGPAGLGKTHLAIAILNEVTKAKGRHALYVNFSDLLLKIQSTFRTDAAETKEDVITPYADVELLVLDELGATKPSDFARDMLYALLNTRYNHKRITIATSNYMDELSGGAREKLEDRIGYTLRSRLHEMCQTIHLSGDDYRLTVGRAGDRPLTSR